MTRSIALLALSLSVSSAWTSLAQNSQSYLNDVGSPAYSVNVPVENGFINVSNGNLHLEFPLASPPQRGALSVSERLVYDSRIWMFSPFGTHGSYHWWPYNVPGTSTTSGGWQLIKGNEVGTVGYNVVSQNINLCNDGGDPDGRDGSLSDTYTTSSITWTDPAGTTHSFNAIYNSDVNECSGGYSFTASVTGGRSTDASGYTIPSDPDGNIRIIDGNGTQDYPTVIDRFGNFLSADTSGNLVDDTGRIPVITTQNGSTTYYDVLSPNGTINNNGVRVRYTVTNALVPVRTGFNQSDIYEWVSPQSSGQVPLLNPVQSIQLPDGSSYTFTYDIYGGLNSVTLPTGGTVHYDYGNFLDSANTENRWLELRALGSTAPMRITPTVGTTCANYSTGCKEYVILHKPSGDETMYELTLTNGAWNTSMGAYTGAVPYHTSGVPGPGSGATNLLAFTANTNQYSNPCSGANCTNGNNLLSTLATTVMTTNGSASLYTQAYQLFDTTSGKIISSKEWDYSSQTSSINYATPPSSTPTRETDYSYTGFDPSQTTVVDGSGHQAGQTLYTYTGNATATSGISGHGTQNAGGPYLYSVAHWLSTGQANPTTVYTYDDTGMVNTVKDPNGIPASVSYQCSNSLPYQAQNTLNQISQSSYDCSSGALLSAQDPNDRAAGRSGTVYAYESLAGRPYTVTRPDGGLTTYSYPSALEVDSVTAAAPDPDITNRTTVDAYGRSSASVSGGIETDTTYDANGRVNCTTNPYTTSPTGSTCITSYDGLDRPLSQVMADGVSTRTWSYAANSTTSTDERGISWTRTKNVFGKLTGVVEPGNLISSYAYDGLGNLTNITQSGSSAAGDAPRVRTFTYDSMSRLLTSTTPEAGTICYGFWRVGTFSSGPSCAGGYDSNGNLLYRTDARQIKTTYTYDLLNRLTVKSYSDGTLSDAYGYDGADEFGTPLSQHNIMSNNAIGRLSINSNQHTAGEAYSYDAGGRLVLQSTLLPSTSTYSVLVKAGYDLAGNMTDFTFPDGRHTQQTFDAAGRLGTSNLVDINGSPASQSYLQSAVYSPDSSLNTLTLGNGVVQTLTENTRLQTQSIVVTSPLLPFSGQTLLSHTYCYLNCATGGTANNGSIWDITDTLDGTRTQSFTYDNLNRISKFYLNGFLNQQYSIDSFGNLSGMSGGNPTQTFDPATNRISNLPCASSVTAFDGAGNQMCDSDPYGGVRQYSYDAANRLIGVSTTNSPPFEKYVYGAGGTRVRKIDPNNQYTDYVYFGGQVVAESRSGNWTDYIYANGQKIAMEQSASSLWMHGSSGAVEGVVNLSLSGPITIASGDKLSWFQSQQSSGGTAGGVNLTFQNGWALNGACASCSGQPAAGVDQNNVQVDKWNGNFAYTSRTVDLSNYAGQTVNGAQLLRDAASPGGDWDLLFSFISITHANGQVDTIYDGVHPIGFNMPSAPGLYNNFAWYNGVAGPNTRFYASDHLGSAQMEFAPGGWPLSSTQFTPFGDAIGTQNANNYRFTGLEHDAESGEEHAQFRQLASLQGRWMSADPYDGSMNVNDPQTLNRYGYVGNMPLSFTDPSGEEPGSVVAACLAGPIACIGGAAATAIFDYEISKLFGHPKFTGSHTARPNSHPWDEHGSYQVKPYSGIAGILGISGGCEFGACGAGFLNQTPINENKTLQQKIAELAAAGVFVGPLETKYSPFHKGQITLRDNKRFCSQHVALDQGSGSGGHPVTGESHYDLVNPWSFIPASTYFHTLYDLIPDKVQDRFPGFPTGSDLCK